MDIVPIRDKVNVVFDGKFRITLWSPPPPLIFVLKNKIITRLSSQFMNKMMHPSRKIKSVGEIGQLDWKNPFINLHFIN